MRGYHDWVFRSIAWMPQRQATGAFPLLVHELLASSTNPVAAQDAAAALAVDTLAERNLSTLSGGQLQRVFLARALGCLAGGAALLIADEPTAALDFAGQQIMAQLLTESAHTMLVVTHDRALIERCDRIYEMAGGQMREVSR
jgi:ABC-type Mn2+/Zn2+ transport system ATPase subunit